jgi:hypothetical protein
MNIQYHFILGTMSLFFAGRINLVTWYKIHRTQLVLTWHSGSSGMYKASTKIEITKW